MSRLTKLAAAIAITLACFLAATQCHAFELNGGSWAGARVTYRINPNFPESAGTQDEVIAAIRCGGDAWAQQSHAPFDFNYAGLTDADGRRSRLGTAVAYADRDGNGALATTLISGDEQTGRLDWFGIAFWAEIDNNPIRWSAASDPPPGTWDLRGVATHEFGHALGLHHTAVEGATMLAGASERATSMRTLHADDIAGVEFLYGLSGDAPRVSVGSTSPANGPADGGYSIQVHGNNFTSTDETSVFIDGVEVPIDVVNCDTILIIEMPAGEEEEQPTIRVLNSLGDVSVVGPFRYGPAPPVVSSIEPSISPLSGTGVTIRGANFTQDTEFFVGNQALLNATFVDAQTVTGTAAPVADERLVDVRAVERNLESVLNDAFSYTSKVLSLGSARGTPGSDVRIEARLTSNENVGGLSFAFSFDSSKLEVLSISNDGGVGEDAMFAAPNIDNASGVATFGLVMAFAGVEPSIPAGSDLLVATIDVRIAESAEIGDELPIRLLLSGGVPPINLLVTPPGESEGTVPVTIDGSVSVGDVLFRRGDVDRSGTLNITDAIFHLAALFQGGPATTCQDAGDSNDDGNLDISDAVYSLVFLFNGGNAPPVPFSEAGTDPTEDLLGCEA